MQSVRARRPWRGLRRRRRDDGDATGDDDDDADDRQNGDETDGADDADDTDDTGFTAPRLHGFTGRTALGHVPAGARAVGSGLVKRGAGGCPQHAGC